MNVLVEAGTLIEVIQSVLVMPGIDDLAIGFVSRKNKTDTDMIISGGTAIDQSRFCHIECDKVTVEVGGVWGIAQPELVLARLKNFGDDEELLLTGEGDQIRAKSTSRAKYYDLPNSGEITCKRRFIPEITDELHLVLHRISDDATMTLATMTFEATVDPKYLKPMFKDSDVFKDSLKLEWINGALTVYSEIDSYGGGDVIPVVELYTDPGTDIHSFYQGLSPVMKSLTGEVVIYFASESLIYIEDIRSNMSAYYLTMQRADLR